MNQIIGNSVATTAHKHFLQLRKYFFGLLVVSLSLSAISCSSPEDQSEQLTIDSVLQQAVFLSPENAAQSLVDAVSTNDIEMLSKILGTNFRDVLPIENISDQDTANFLTAWEKKNTLLTDGEDKRFIAIGKEQWTFPIPIVVNKAGWFFDIEQGSELISIRRIGRNELNTIQILLAYHDAQTEYAEQDRDGDGTREYARKFKSSPGSHDGLFWKENPSKKVENLKKLLAEKGPGGSYHGYYFKILNAQGTDTKDGANDYIVNGKMLNGFALISWPRDYGVSGVMSFIMNQEGVVFEQDLGQTSLDIASAINTFNPTSDWKLTEDTSLIQ